MQGFPNIELNQIFRLFSNQLDCIVVINSENRICYINPNAERMFQVGMDSLINRPLETLILNYQNINKTNELHIAVKNLNEYFWINVYSQKIPFEGNTYEVLLIHEINQWKIEKDKENEKKLNFVNTIANLQNGIFSMRKDEDGNFIYSMVIGKLMEEIGASTKNLINRRPEEVFPEHISIIKEEHYKKAFEGKRSTYEVELNGKQVFVDVMPVQIGNVITEIVGTVLDISELRSTQKELQINQQQFQSLFKNSQDYIVLFDKDLNVNDMNPKTRKLFKLTKDTEDVHIKDLIPQDYLGMIKSYLVKALRGTIENFDLNVGNTVKGDLSLNITLLPISFHNEIEGIYMIGKDITEEKKIRETNAYLAHHDELTEIYNRRWMEKKISESLQRAKSDNLQLAVLLIDLDRFKAVNDTLGHFIGDDLLTQISKRILESIDKKKHYAARMGGDEFMILCPNIQSSQEVVALAEKFLNSLNQPIFIGELELLVTASIGISFYPTDGTNVVEILKKADIALYKSKDLGRNMYQVYDQTMTKTNYQTFVLERDLRKAVLNNEFIAYLQPRVDALTGKTIGAEALIRWKHPIIGLVSPGDFIPLAEETGLIIPIGKWMKKRVCEQLVAWRKAGLPLLPISVNISSQRFLQKSFSKDIRDLLNEYQLEGKYLEIEITENSIMKNEDTVTQTLRELKELGVKIFIDDFGTGYSSFNYLKTFNLDGVKIDRSFIQNISRHSENASITSAMIKMAQHLKLDVIAEGVETKQELDFLLEQNCHQIQGFYFGKPCPINDFERNFLLNS